MCLVQGRVLGEEGTGAFSGLYPPCLAWVYLVFRSSTDWIALPRKQLMSYLTSPKHTISLDVKIATLDTAGGVRTHMHPFGSFKYRGQI